MSINSELEICTKTQDEGFGAVYERIVLERFLERVQKKYGFKEVLELECPITKGFDNLVLKGIGCGINVSSKNLEQLKEKWDKFKEKPKFISMDSKEKYDLVWNFAVVQLDPKIIIEMKKKSKKYVLIFVPNILNYGTPFHLAYHLMTGLPCYHAERGSVKIRRRVGLKKIVERFGLRVIESGYIDMPWWPDTAFGIREVKENILKMTLKPVEKEFKDPKKYMRSINSMTFIEYNKFLGSIKYFFAHHTYVFCELK